MPLIISCSVVLIVFAAVFGFFYFTPQPAARLGENVSISYALVLDDGSVYETNFNTTPVTFTLGEADVLPGFTEAVEGMSVGQIRSVTFPASANVFGEYNASLVHTVDRSNFAQTNFTVGQTYYVVNHLTGAMSRIQILNVTNDTVTWDANSPLAGKDITFVIRLDAIANP